MPNDFAHARRLVANMRYGGENHSLLPQQNRITTDAIWSHMSQTGMEITPEVIPGVAALISQCCENLTADDAGVRSFVYPSEDFQASCLPINKDQCAIRISSTLIERLDHKELAFVIGHELGHFLLDHLITDLPSKDSLEYYSIKRAQEISSDRIGLIACGDVDAAIRAIMKTVSGLGSDHIRFDTARYLSSSIENIRSYHDPSQMYSSHPNMSVRARSLIWFSDFIKANKQYDDAIRQDAFNKMDARVINDMEKYVEVSTNNRIHQYKEEASSWIWLGAAVTDGCFSSEEQDYLSDKFGSQFIYKIKDILSSLPMSDVFSFVCNKAEHSINTLIGSSPIHGEKFVAKEITNSEAVFLCDNHKSIINTHYETATQ